MSTYRIAVIRRIFNGNPPLSWYVLSWPKELDTKQVHAWLQSIGSNQASQGVRFIAVANKDSIKHYLALPYQHEQNFLASLSSFLPDVELSSCEPVVMATQQASKVRMTSKNRVLNTSHPEIVSFAILNALQTLNSNECIVLIWILGQCKSPEIIPTNLTSLHSSSMSGAVVEALIGGVPSKLDAPALKSKRDKYTSAAWKATLLIGITASTKKRRAQLVNHVIGAIKIAEAPGVRLGSQSIAPKRLSSANSPLFWPLIINVDELLGLLAWPLGNRIVGGLARITSRQLPMPVDTPGKGRIIASSTIKDSKAKLVLSPVDNLMHLHVLGPTGVGKSTLLLNLITQDIMNGYGVVVVDPKGDLVNDVLSRIPANRQEDIVILDPSDMNHPVGLNPLANTNKAPSLIADEILTIFRKLYGSYFGPRTQDILHSGLLTLLINPCPNLCALPMLYMNYEFRQRLVRNINDPLGLGSFWDWYEKLSPAERNSAIAPVMNKLRTFLLRPNIRMVMGQSTPKFDMSDVFIKRKVLLVNLASLGSEASQLFGSLVVSQIWQAAQNRASVPQEKRFPTFLYIDECQNFLNLPTDINDVLAQARSFGLGLILANQHLGQLPKDLKIGTLANARSRVCFQLTHDDALIMAQSTDLLKPEDFESLPNHQIYAKFVKYGQVSNWVSGKTVAASEVISNPGELRALSRERYGRSVSEVEAELNNLIAPRQPSTTNNFTGEVNIGRKKIDTKYSNQDPPGDLS